MIKVIRKYEEEFNKNIGLRKLQKELKDCGLEVKQTKPGVFYLYDFCENIDGEMEGIEEEIVEEDI